MQPCNILILGWDHAIARYQPRPCGQQGGFASIFFQKYILPNYFLWKYFLWKNTFVEIFFVKNYFWRKYFLQKIIFGGNISGIKISYNRQDYKKVKSKDKNNFIQFFPIFPYYYNFLHDWLILRTQVIQTKSSERFQFSLCVKSIPSLMSFLLP